MARYGTDRLIERERLQDVPVQSECAAIDTLDWTLYRACEAHGRDDRLTPALIASVRSLLNDTHLSRYSNVIYRIEK
jgi:hypothetical protein